MSDNGLCLENMQVWHGAELIVDLHLTVAPGEIVTIMAPSGAGKSTALAAILGVLSPDFTQKGRVLLKGQDVSVLPAHQRRIGLLFQEDTLFPHLSVGGNLAFAIPPDIRGHKRRLAVVEKALADIGLEGYANRDPATLSGGQKARVTLMRSLLARPLALLLDEPFSKLDSTLREHVRQFVYERLRQEQLPTLLVTHDAQDARQAGGRMISLFG